MIKSLSCAHGVDSRFSAPPSKSYTHRAMIIAALSNGMSFLHNPLIADDTLLTRKALESLGVKIYDGQDLMRIGGVDGQFT